MGVYIKRLVKFNKIAKKFNLIFYVGVKLINYVYN